MQRDQKQVKEAAVQQSKPFVKKMQIPRYSDKFKEIIAKSELARLQNTLPQPKQQQPLQTIPDKFFYRIKSIGVGAHSFVYLVQQEQTHLLLAEKSITKQHAREIADDLLRQVKLLLCLNHQHIIKLYHVYASETHVNLLLQFAQDSLFALKQRFSIFKEKEIVEVLRQLLLALKHLHDKNIVHADVKLENVMIANVAPTISRALSNYVISAWLTLAANRQGALKIVGTLEYLPPEYVQGADSAHARDIWALGILAFEMSVGKHPFEDLKQSEKWAKLIKSPPQLYCQQMRQLQGQLGVHCQKIEQVASHIFVDWKKRWSAQQLLQLPFFNQNKQ